MSAPLLFGNLAPWKIIVGCSADADLTLRMLAPLLRAVTFQCVRNMT